MDIVRGLVAFMWEIFLQSVLEKGAPYPVKRVVIAQRIWRLMSA